MYKINIFDNINMPIDWYMVYWGTKNKLLNLDVAQDYACKRIAQDDNVSAEEMELSWKSDNLTEILEMIERIPEFQDNIEEHMIKAKDKIRIAIILFLRKTEHDISKLLEKIDLVYADFDYPEDMEKFISYMPIDDEYISVKHSVDENRRYLLSKLDLFIKEQEEKYKLDNV